MVIFFFFFVAVRSTSWRGGDTENNSNIPIDLSNPSPNRLERSRSSNSGLGREHGNESGQPTAVRRLPGNNNVSWDDDNLPEW